MKKYKTLLWDVDGTLLDFHGAEQKGITAVFAKHGIAVSQIQIEKYREINAGFWRAYERGEVAKEDIFSGRFPKLLQEIGIDGDGMVFEEEYRMELDANHDLITGAKELCKDLFPKYSMYIVTNGIAETQYRRLAESGLTGYFADIFISEEIGCQKPSMGFFEFCFGKIPNKDKETILIIGDSLSADMLGGIHAGIDTCWYNPDNEGNHMQLPVTYMIKDLQELLGILK